MEQQTPIRAGKLGPNQLSWSRLHIPGFREAERRAERMIREVEDNKRRHPVTVTA